MARSLDFHRTPRPAAASTPPPRKRRSSSGLIIVVVVVIILIAILAGSGFDLFASPAETPTTATTTPSRAPITSTSALTTPPFIPTTTVLPTQTTTPSLTPIPTPSATPTPTPTATTPAITKQNASLRILNGSGTAGQANVVRHAVEARGWRVRLIAVASTRRATTIVYYRDGLQELATNLATDLNRKNTLEKNNTILGTDDILVIVGSQ